MNSKVFGIVGRLPIFENYRCIFDIFIWHVRECSRIARTQRWFILTVLVDLSALIIDKIIDSREYGSIVLIEILYFHMLNEI